MFPWDFDRHLDSQHSRCKVRQQYLVDEKMLQDYMDLKHPTLAVKPVVTEEQATRDSATLDADRQDHQVKLGGLLGPQTVRVSGTSETE